MTPFSYRRATGVKDAIAAAASSGTAFLAGGTELLNWMRLNIAAPDRVVDISRIPGLDRIEPHGNSGLSVGALVRLADLGAHELVSRDYPVLAQAVLQAASPQLRNLATLGGNLLQATRCAYFRSEDALPCNKRAAGSGCSARHGLNARHAIFGWSDACVATQPSDPAVALAVLDATIVTAGPDGERRIPARSFHTLPDDAPECHNVLQQGELITAVELPRPAPLSVYLKVSHRAAYDFATVSAAVSLEVEGDVVRRAQVALGSVAHRPWRLDSAEQGLQGLRIGSPAARAVIDAAFGDAIALEHNAYKIPLARNAVLRALAIAAALA
jgi:xanthine dehydrogenase YagS FAD-binding subunit